MCLSLSLPKCVFTIRTNQFEKQTGLLSVLSPASLLYLKFQAAISCFICTVLFVEYKQIK